MSAEEVQLSNFVNNFKEAKYCRGDNSRLCGNPTQLETNLKYEESGDKNGNL